MRYRASLDEPGADRGWVSTGRPLHTWDPGLVGYWDAAGLLLLMVDVAP